MAKDPFTIMKNATQKAFQKVGKTIGQETDPALRLYDSLRADDFVGLMQEFGEEGVIEYIKEMEAKKMGVKGGNNA